MSIAEGVTKVPFSFNKKEMVLHTWRTRLFPQDYHALKWKKKKQKWQGNENNKLVLVSLSPTWC